MLTYPAYTDQQLLSLVGEGNERAYAEIYERYWELLFRHALRILQDPDLAKDAVQDVFTALWSNRTTIDNRGKLSAFLYRSVRNRVFDLIDHSKVKEAYLTTVAGIAAEGTWAVDEHIREQELAATIDREIASLPEGMRRVFELSREKGMSYREIATELQISENTVKVQVSKALRILRSALRMLMGILFFTLFGI